MRNLKWNEIFRRSMATLLAFAMVFGMLPSIPFAHVHAEGEEAAQQTETSFAGKTVSILSHSMSTYAGVSNNPAYNSTIGSNDVYYTEGRHGVYREDTWWQQAIDALGMELLVNNSWSGSCVFMPRKGEASVGYGDRAVNLHNDSTGEEPDIIWVYLGCNDFAYYKDTFGTAEDIDYAALILDNGDGTFTYSEPKTTCEAYAIMLHKVENRYPEAEIYCMTSTARRDPDYADNYADTGQPTAYSAELHKVAAYFGFPVIDLENAIPKEAEIFDQYIGDKRAHANALGMDQITNAVLSAMLGRSAEIRHVTPESGAVAEQAVLLGGSYSAEIELPEGYSPVVTMDGKDITAEAYKDGNITIGKVTGDIEVSLKRAEKNFRWELNDDVFETVTGYSFSENTLTLLEGSIENGIFSGVKYALSDNIYLYHDQPWIVEWACTGNWDATLFANVDKGGIKGAEVLFRSSTDCNLLAIGEYDGTQYNNYGIATGDLDLDMTQRHVYRLENRVSADGNMIWLYIDAAEIGPMDNYYIGSRNDTGNTSDWVSGKDFAFGYMGTVVRAINDCSLEYVEVWEAGHTHTYEKDICTGCGAEDPAYTDLSGKTVSILGDSISTYTGVSNNTAYNSTLGNNAVYYSAGTLGVYREDTWWQQTIDALDMELLVNNSWSGSCILHTRSNTVGAYVDRCIQLHDDTTGEEPDVILVFMGTNDFSYYQSKLGTADIDYDTLIVENADGSFTYAAPTTSCEAYAIMLHKMTKRYPDAEIYCMTMLARRDPIYSGADVGQPTAFNAELVKIIKRFGATPVDMESCGITSDPANFDLYMGDKRVHPNAAGMDKMSEAVIGALTGEKTELFTLTAQLTNAVFTEESSRILLSGDSYRASVTCQFGFTDLQVTVTMGGVDITDSCYGDGVIEISNVIGDVTVTAQALTRIPQSYRWEFNGSDLVSVGDTENTLTKLAGTTSDGVFTSTRYRMAGSVLLQHDLPWILEWKGEGTGGFMLSEASSASSAPFFFRRAGNYLNAFGNYNGSQYNNYGVALNTTDIDGSANHVYRLENRIAGDGSNMVYLYVDGVEVGALDNYFIGGSAQNTTGNWINGKDFAINYIGSESHPLTDYALEYLLVVEDGSVSKPMSMRYDDHVDVTGKTVQIVDAGKPTSYKVGYGVAEGTLDDAVVTLVGDTLIATGIGTAQVRIDGQLYEVTVTAAPISLLLLIGQSNMQGSEGNAEQSIVCPDGLVYSTYGDRYTMTVSNATNFAPSALTGEGSTVNVNGTTTNLKDWPVYLLNEAGDGKIGPDSGFAYEWVKQTGEKVWVVNAAHGGTNITAWQDGGAQYEECVLLFQACLQTLHKEIDAGHFTLSHMGYFWCQGCTNYSNTAEWYVEKYLAMHNNLKTELAFSEDVTFEFGGIIPVRAGHEYYTSYRQGVYKDTTTAAYHESFKDLRFTGPRVAQYWMTNNPELPDIWNVCNIGEDWVWMPDGTNGVAEYFQAHYPGGTVDYTTQVQQSASWYTPTTPKAVHDSIHYNQIGYNEVGREAARNALIMLGEIEAPNVETTVEFLTWDGYTPAEQVSAFTAGNSKTLVVPKVYPVWKSKEVTYQLTEGLSWNYYDLLASSTLTEGTLSAVGVDSVSVSVVKQEPCEYFADHLSQLPEDICCGLNLWTLLEHEAVYYKPSEAGYGKHSSGSIYSVTIPVQPGDRIYANSFRSNSESGNTVSSSDGIRVTYFGEFEVVKSMAGSETYAEYVAKGGYIVVPEGTVAVNIPMWNNSDDNEIYILSFSHDTTSEICSICGKSSHSHEWSAWETVTSPSIDGPGSEQRSCACGETETREVEGVWQTCDLTEHMAALPERICNGVNLWAEMEHDKYFYSGGTKWGIHSSGTVYSVTIPVSAGEKIYASSFGKGGTHGSSSNGIRVTFFDAKGVNKTLTPAETYAEFTANGGYLIAPEGTVAINIPMWTNSDEWEIYILGREHDYKGTACTICGAEHPEAGDYSGKVISILGDSISTFAGYIPVEDGFNLEHRTRYPDTSKIPDVTAVEQTWWMQTITALDAKLGINDSWAGSTVYWGDNMLTQNSDTGEKAAMASLTRIQNLGANGTPDVIFFYGGGNDMTKTVTVGTFDPSAAPADADLTATQWENFADAYVATILRLKYYYPDAQIVAVVQNPSARWTEAKRTQYTAVIEAVCQHYNIPYVRLEDSGITQENLPDGVHPDAEGMDFITDAVLETLLGTCTVEPGEHVVHSVTHELTGAESSLSYYKGVSHGKSFVTTVTGENLTVTVTMGGQDITDSVWKDGVVNIPKVTSDVVITAEGRIKTVYEDHLQQLPDSVCAGTNLWTVLEPEKIYYTVNGWGQTTSGNAHSVTFPVSAGERIWATSFGAAGENGDTKNGTRITWFDEDGVLVSLTRDAVYAEFVANGYVTAPEGAVAVNIPMASDSKSFEVYLIKREHNPGEEVRENETANGSHELAVYCTCCGVELSREMVTLHIPGDINGDGNVDNKDLTRLFRHLSGYDVEVVKAALDVNGDGSVNNKDQTRLFRYLSGWDVEIY